jgi:hypothetical protein
LKFPQIALLAKPRPHQVRALDAIGSVLKSNGYRVRESFDLSAPEPIVFVWSWGKAMIQRQKFPSAIICCLDHGYTANRAKYINTGWSVPSMECGLNGFAEHAWVKDPDGKRARAMDLYDELAPEKRTPLERALLLGQVYGDAMIVTQVRDYSQWLREMSQVLQDVGYAVTFRPHPVMVRRGQAHAYGNLGRLTGNRDLRADLSEADIAVALNSNGLVEAFLAGVQPYAYNGGTMLSPILDGPLAQFQYRKPWLNKLAWAQWTPEELEDGTWFKHHAPIMHRLVETGECRPWNLKRPEDL